MKNHNFLKVILLAASLLAMSSSFNIGSAANNAASEKAEAAALKKTEQNDSTKYIPKTGYEIDGRTTASVLAAKRSHSVSEQDQSGLATFLGIIVVGVIIFFVTGRKT